MYKTLYFLFIVAFFSCSKPQSSDNELPVGQAILKIDNKVYEATAIMDSQTLNETEFEKISIIISDSVFVGILKERFVEETITWTGETLNPDGVIFYLIYQYVGGAYYSPHAGSLSIINCTDSTIAGEFEIDLYDFTSSSSYSPEDLVRIIGQFVVGVN